MAAQLAPLPSKVTANLTLKEDLVAVIRRDGLRLGTSADAGAVCVTALSKGKGVTGDTYRFYVRTQGAPGPYQVRSKLTGKMVSARDDDGRELFDLDAVERWNASRPGSGTRTGRPLKWTAMREELLTAARDGHLVRAEKTGRPFITTTSTTKRLTPREVQRLRELVDADLIQLPTRGRRYRLSAAGKQWLAEHARDRPVPARAG